MGSWLFDDFFHRNERKGDFERDRDPLVFGGLVAVAAEARDDEGRAVRVDDVATRR